MRVVHIITGLEVGGAERMLERMVLFMLRESPSIENIVVSLSRGGVIGMKLRDCGIEVIELDLKSFFELPLAIIRLASHFKNIRPTIVQSWMYRSDLIAGIAARLCGIPNVVWGIRCTQIPSKSSLAVKILVRVNALLSFVIPQYIVCCAEEARNFHSRIGFNEKKMVVIPNGFDFDLFKPEDTDRSNVRNELGFDEKKIVVGIVGRYDELKDYGNFISAAAMAAEENENLHFLMIGSELDNTNQALNDHIVAAGIQNRITLFGPTNAVERMMRGLDIYCMSSSSEGFPNVVVEAMGTALPCIVTDVGDAALIVGDCGAIVPRCNPRQLAGKIIEYAKLPNNELTSIGRKARLRAEKNYSLSAVTQKYRDLYETMCIEK